MLFDILYKACVCLENREPTNVSIKVIFVINICTMMTHTRILNRFFTSIEVHSKEGSLSFILIDNP